MEPVVLFFSPAFHIFQAKAPQSAFTGRVPARRCSRHRRVEGHSDRDSRTLLLASGCSGSLKMPYPYSVERRYVADNLGGAPRLYYTISVT